MCEMWFDRRKLGSPRTDRTAAFQCFKRHSAPETAQGVFTPGSDGEEKDRFEKEKERGREKVRHQQKEIFLEMLLCVCEIELDDECVMLGSFSPFPSFLKYSVRWRSVMSAFKCVCSAVWVKY